MRRRPPKCHADREDPTCPRCQKRLSERERLAKKKALMPSNQWSIYALEDPRTDAVRYVGCTSSELRSRLNAHIESAKRRPESGRRRSDWINELLAAGLRPVIRLLEVVVDWETAERSWIARFRDSGAQLTNAADGGIGNRGCRASEETKGKISRFFSTVERTPEWCKNISAAKLSMSADRRADIAKKISAANTGRVRSAEARAKMSAAAKGRTMSTEQRAAISAALIGRKKVKHGPTN